MNNLLQYQSILKSRGVHCIQSRTTFGSIFSADEISGGQVNFHYKTLCISLEAFASKKERFLKIIYILALKEIIKIK